MLLILSFSKIVFVIIYKQHVSEPPLKMSLTSYIALICASFCIVQHAIIAFVKTLKEAPYSFQNISVF